MMSSKDGQPVRVTITPATTADIPDLDAIADAAHQQQIYPSLSAAGVETLEGQRCRRWQRPLNDDGFGALKAMLDDATVGYIRWRDDYFVFALYVAVEHQGQGVGRQLLDAMVAQCPPTDIQLRSSINAVGFYQRYGFVAQGDEEVIDGIRFVPMVYHP